MPRTSIALLLLSLAPAGACFADLVAYDASIADDEASNGLVPAATLTAAATFDGTNNQAFDFGSVSGEVTMEFILEGNPSAIGGAGYLAVGSNSVSSLRYEQWNNTGQIGFTQSGVLDYLFSPPVLSPPAPVHLAYSWDGDGRMDLYLNGVAIGQRSGVVASFSMPIGNGYLGNVAGGGQGMVGTIHRVTVYDKALDASAILRHSDAYNDVKYPPVINSFAAAPDAYLAPGSSTLSWDVSGADSLEVNGAVVTGQTEMPVSPGVTTSYTLIARNGDGTTERTTAVTVDPPATVSSFSTDRAIIGQGEGATLSWDTDFATAWDISPAPGDVTGQTVAGAGSVPVTPTSTTTYTLTAFGNFGNATAEVIVEVAMVAPHAVISEFVADNETGLTDGDGHYEDWIEIFNPTGSAIDLAGYFLTDDAGDLTQWQFPSHVLAPGGRVIVFASNKHPNPPAGELHTNFRLNNDGEYLALVAPDGTTILHEFSPTFPPQSNDVSYGILGGDLSRVQFMGIPTPGDTNDPSPPAPAAVEFSIPSRTFSGSISVALNSATAGASIFFTTDGSTPSSANGTEYQAAIPIGATTHLRAVAEFASQAGPVSGEMYIRLAADLENYQSDLPLLVIDNFGAGTIPAKGWSGTGAGVQQVERQSAVWATFDRDPGTGLAAFADAPQMISRTGIRGRGAYSSTWTQKPYSVEAWDEDGDERDVGVLGMPAHSDWVLYYPDVGSNKDPPMMFNSFMYDLSRNMGRYAARLRWVEAFVNEDGGDLSLTDRRGVYTIIEKVSRGSDRLDFTRLSEDGASGGFLLGLNRMDSVPAGGFPAQNGATQPQFFHTRGPNRVSQTAPNTAGSGDDIPRQSNGFLNFDNPNGYKINPTQRAAIEDWFGTFEDVLYNDSIWLDLDNGYRQYLDAEDFVDYFILNNLSRNGDGLLISMFPWVDDDGVLRMGPAWDYNYASFQGSGSPQGTLFHRSDRIWYGRLLDDPDFLQLYIDRWFHHRDGAMSNAGLVAIIDGQAAEIGGIRAVRQGHTSEAAWQAELTTLKDWLTARCDWYDAQFSPRPEFTTPGGDVPNGFNARFDNPAGTVYFTTDGSDPRAPGGAVATTATAYDGSLLTTSLVATGHPVRVLIPTATNPPAGLGWTEAGFDDASWSAGTTGVGYDRVTDYDPEISLNLDATMDWVNASAYLRLEFDVADASIYDVLTLRMKYDDGFIAYLNGEEVASANPPALPAWDSDANGGHADNDAVQFVDFPIDGHLGELVDGTNVLAIHGLNDSINSSDFLIVPELRAGQSAAGGGIALDTSMLITARTRIGSDWSAPASEYYFVDTVPATAANLVVSEIHYRPADASPAEVAAGISDRDAFEFIELMNSGSQTLNLSEVRFVRSGGEGIEFDFSTSNLQTLEPGARILLVKNASAFEIRYGGGIAADVAGVYTGNLSNDGELLTLIGTGDATIRSFSYNDKSPWPEGPDGGGFSLVLIDPGQSPPPDHSDPFNWRASLAAGGTPGGTDGNTYSSWKTANGVPTPELVPDLDGDNRDTLLEYAQGTSPTSPDTSPMTGVTVEPIEVGGVTDDYFFFRFARSLDADDVDITAQVSTDLLDWQNGAAALVFVGRERTGPSSENLVFRSAAPAASHLRLFARFEVSDR